MVSDEKEKVLDLNVKMMFHLGMWYDPPGGSFHQGEYYGRRLARVILHHRHLDATLRHARKIFAWANFLFLALQIFVIHPVNIFMNWGNRVDIAESLYGLYIYTVLVIAIVMFSWQKRETREMMEKYEKLAHARRLDNRRQRETIDRLRRLSRILTKFSYLIVPFMMIAVIIYLVVDVIPNRKQLFKGWYPYNEYASPAYEMTLIANGVQLVVLSVFGATMSSTGTLLFYYLVVLFKVATSKFLNVRVTAMENIREKKLRGMRLRGLDVSSPRGGWEDDLAEGVSHNVGVECGKVGPNATRLENPALLQPLRDSTLRGQLKGEGRILKNTRLHQSYTFARRLSQTTLNLEVSRPKMLKNHEDKTNYRRSRRGRSTQNMVEFRPEIVKNLKDITTLELEREMHRVMVSCVKYHQDVLDLSKSLWNIMRIFFMCLFLCNVVGYGLTVLVVANVSRITLKEVIFLVVTFYLVVLFLIYNWLANLTTDQSAEVSKAIYASDWLRASKSFNKSVLIVMIRANKPVSFKTFGLEPLSLKFFGEVSKIGYKMVATMQNFVK